MLLLAYRPLAKHKVCYVREHPEIYIDIEISADGDMRLADAHAVAERVHDKIESSLSSVKHCMVHINPHINNFADAE